ncbi:endolytic transglycosylase MltG [soil metagenome]
MRKLSFIFAIIAIFVIAIFWWTFNLSPVNSRDHNEVMFTVSQGAGIKAIARDLQSQGLIKNGFVFALMAQQSGISSKVQAGDFRLSPALTAQQIVTRLTKGVEDVWVTIPEGKRAEEVAAILKDKMPNYEDNWDSQLPSHEGYLFPDTYLLPHNATIGTIVTTLTDTSAQRYKEVTVSKTSLTQAQIITLASLIEREARHSADRPLISSVIHNRLSIGMPLQIDATIQYALGQQSNGSWWKKDLTYADLKINSPYNTYTNTGLPPAPICSPGIESIKAAAAPASTNYLYYITDKNGINHYAKTNAEHEANIRKYGL